MGKNTDIVDYDFDIQDDMMNPVTYGNTLTRVNDKIDLSGLKKKLADAKLEAKYLTPAEVAKKYTDIGLDILEAQAIEAEKSNPSTLRYLILRIMSQGLKQQSYLAINAARLTQEDSLNTQSPRFQKAVEWLVETFCKALDNSNIDQNTKNLICSNLAVLMYDYESKLKRNLAPGVFTAASQVKNPIIIDFEKYKKVAEEVLKSKLDLDKQAEDED